MLDSHGRVAIAGDGPNDAQKITGGEEDRPIGRPVAAGRADEQRDHVELALGVARLDRDDVSRRVVEDRVDAHRLLVRERRRMADVGVP